MATLSKPIFPLNLTLKIPFPPTGGSHYLAVQLTLNKTEDSTASPITYRRKKDAIVYYPEHDPKIREEAFYYSILSLFTPWRTEADILHGNWSEKVRVRKWQKDLVKKSLSTYPILPSDNNRPPFGDQLSA